MEDAKEKISVYSYNNYREFLADMCAWLKVKRQGYSFRNISRLAGFRSPNFIQLLIKGQKNLAADSIDRLASALKLNREETKFFHSLVLFTQSSNTQEKSLHAETLLRSRPFRKINPLKNSELRYYSRWYSVPIREMASMKSFQEDPAWIASHLDPPIMASEAEQSLKEMTELGLLQKNESGKLEPTSETLSTGDEVSWVFVKQYHQEMIRKGAEALDRFKAKERDISSLTLKLTPAKYLKALEKIRVLRKELLALEQQSEEGENAEKVYQINFQTFPLTKEISHCEDGFAGRSNPNTGSPPASESQSR